MGRRRHHVPVLHCFETLNLLFGDKDRVGILPEGVDTKTLMRSMRSTGSGVHQHVRETPLTHMRAALLRNSCLNDGFNPPIEEVALMAMELRLEAMRGRLPDEERAILDRFYAMCQEDGAMFEFARTYYLSEARQSSYWIDFYHATRTCTRWMDVDGDEEQMKLYKPRVMPMLTAELVFHGREGVCSDLTPLEVLWCLEMRHMDRISSVREVLRALWLSQNWFGDKWCVWHAFLKARFELATEEVEEVGVGVEEEKGQEEEKGVEGGEDEVVGFHLDRQVAWLELVSRHLQSHSTSSAPLTSTARLFLKVATEGAERVMRRLHRLWDEHRSFVYVPLESGLNLYLVWDICEQRRTHVLSCSNLCPHSLGCRSGAEEVCPGAVLCRGAEDLVSALYGVCSTRIFRGIAPLAITDVAPLWHLLSTEALQGSASADACRRLLHGMLLFALRFTTLHMATVREVERDLHRAPPWWLRRGAFDSDTLYESDSEQHQCTLHKNGDPPPPHPSHPHRIFLGIPSLRPHLRICPRFSFRLHPR